MSRYGSFDDFDYENINDIARGEGFSIDEDGHWVPLENSMFSDLMDDTDYSDFDYDDYL